MYCPLHGFPFLEGDVQREIGGRPRPPGLDTIGEVCPRAVISDRVAVNVCVVCGLLAKGAVVLGGHGGPPPEIALELANEPYRTGPRLGGGCHVERLAEEETGDQNRLDVDPSLVGM